MGLDAGVQLERERRRRRAPFVKYREKKKKERNDLIHYSDLERHRTPIKINI